MFMNRSVDQHMFNQSGKVEERATDEEYKSFLDQIKIKVPSNSPTFLNLRLEKPTTSVTMPNSPFNTRKEMESSLKESNGHDKSKCWFNSHIFAAFSERNLAKILNNTPGSEKMIPKSNSHKSISNFDLNAIGPTSF